MEPPSRTPHFLAFYIIWLVLSIAGGTFWIRNAERNRLEDLLVDVRDDAGEVARRLRDTRKENQGFLKALSRTQEVEGLLANPALQAALRNPGKNPTAKLAALPPVASLCRRLETMASDLEARVVFMLAADGRVVASSDWKDPIPSLGMPLLDRDYVRQALAGHAAEAYLVGRHTRTLGIYDAVPLGGTAGHRGCIVMQTSAETWGARLGMDRPPVFISDAGGVVISANRTDWNCTLLPGHPAPPQDHCLITFGVSRLKPLPLQALSPAIFRSADGSQWLQAEYPVPGAPLRVHQLASIKRYQSIRFGIRTLTALVALLGWVLIWIVEKIWTRLDSLHHLAIRDPLTQLLNRRGFDSLASQEWARSTRFDRPLSILAIDLDHFKAINDKHGHHGGDQVLKSAARICQLQVRDMDLVARTGGEEFTILLAETNQERALHVGERIRKTLQDHLITLDATTLRVTLSLGVAERIPGDKTLADVAGRADRALYCAKKLGRNRVEAPSQS